MFERNDLLETTIAPQAADSASTLMVRLLTHFCSYSIVYEASKIAGGPLMPARRELSETNGYWAKVG